MAVGKNEMTLANCIVCPNCGVIVSNLDRHLRKKRCDAVKAKRAER